MGSFEGCVDSVRVSVVANPKIQKNESKSQPFDPHFPSLVGCG